MKKLIVIFDILLCCVSFAVAQPSFREKPEPPKREDFPTAVEKDNTPVNATFSFVALSDLHICDTIEQNSEDLRLAIADINKRTDVAFVLVCGDISHNGDTKSLQLAKKILSTLRVPYYVIPGNHDTRSSESGGVEFSRLFGDSHFRLLFNDYLFFGVNSGSLLRQNDGHIMPEDLEWLQYNLKKIGRKKPVFLVAHHPLKGGDVDNWEKVTDLARQYNVLAVISGHYHRNALLDYDGIQGLVVRSALRDKTERGGYTLFEMSDSLYVSEVRIGEEPERWCTIDLEPRLYANSNEILFPRPNYDINKAYKNVKQVWKKDVAAGVYSGVLVDSIFTYIGDNLGYLHCFNVQKGKELWKKKTPSRLVSSPITCGGKVLFGSTDRFLYCFDKQSGQMNWKLSLGASILKSPIAENDMVYVATSGGKIYAVNVETSAVIWINKNAEGGFSTSLQMDDKYVFAASNDGNVYALNKSTGDVLWKCPITKTPISGVLLANDKLFVVTRDKNLHAIDVVSGTEIYTNNSHKFLGSVGVSNDGETIYLRSQKGKVYAIDATINNYFERWKSDDICEEDTNNSAIAENGRCLVFGTKNGLITALDIETGKIVWQQKIGNTGINKLVPIGVNDWLVTTLDGLVIRLSVK